MPLILAHRGANKRAPQNTLPAFAKAIELGADGIETDVHLSSDGELVICHNYTVDATSNGKGEIKDMSLSELKALDFGSYFSPDFKNTPLPTLPELLKLVSGMKLINIEIKPPKVNNDLVKRTIDEVYKFSLEEKVIISCFDPDCLYKSKEIAPAIKTALLYEKGDLGNEIMSFGEVKFCRQVGVDAVHPQRILLTEQLVKDFHSAGLAVNPWTVNEPKDILDLTAWGCDGLISDVPDVCLATLNK